MKIKTHAVLIWQGDEKVWKLVSSKPRFSEGRSESHDRYDILVYGEATKKHSVRIIDVPKDSYVILETSEQEIEIDG